MVRTLALPNTARNVRGSTFRGVTFLRSVALNEGLRVLGAKEVVDGEEVEGDVFAQSGIESVVLPSTLREVASGTFWKCRNFRSVRFAEGLERIGENAFRETGLGSVVLPASLKSVGEGAFDDCGDLEVRY